jgi:alpha-beta hydrolase superfamily lysophospholipase
MRQLKTLFAVAAALLLGACASTTRSPAAAASAAPSSTACPAGIPAGTRCYSGQDSAGAFFWVAIPAEWNRVLVMHAHGGPELGAPTLARATEDLQRWAVTVKAGYAWAGSTYRRGGYGVTMAAEDTERLRAWFVQQFGAPRRTLLHGQSYGAGVAAKAAELYARVDGRKGPYDGLLLTSGVLGGGTQAYDYRLDLRVVYQYVCNNHPLPTEPAYPLWQGLPRDATLNAAELARRIDDCTGVRRPAAERSAQQRANLEVILSTIRIPERSLVGNMNWSTFLFRDLVQERLDGGNPFGNIGAVYGGPGDDARLNATVLRYRADPAAVARLAADSDPSGRVDIPTLSLHAIDDPTAFVELESAYRAVRERAGTAGLLVQTFSRESEHSYLSDAEYPALFAALLDWIDHGTKPTPADIEARCKRFEPDFGQGCRIDPAYAPRPLSARVPARQRP